MSGRHPMSNQNEFGFGNEIGFGIIISCGGQMIILPPVPSCSTLYPVFCRGGGPLAPTISRHRMFQKHPMSFGKGAGT